MLQEPDYYLGIFTVYSMYPPLVRQAESASPKLTLFPQWYLFF